MKRVKPLQIITLTCFILILAISSIMTACSPAATSTTETVTVTKTATSEQPSQQKFEWKMVTPNAKSNSPGELELQEWLDDIYDASDGRLYIENYANTLGKPADFYGMLESNMIQVIRTGVGNYPDKFPISTIISQPFLFGGPTISATLLNGLYSEGLLKEYDAEKLIYFQTGDALNLFTSKPITSLEELKGLKIRSTHAGVIAALKALGASPTAVDASELYSAAERGIIDGVVTSAAYMDLVKLSEVFKFGIRNVPFGVTLLVGQIGWEQWDSLPEDLQLVVEQQTAGYIQRSPLRTSDRLENYYWQGRFKDAGVEPVYLTEAEYARWQAATASQLEEWVKKMDDLGQPGTEAVKMAKTLISVK